MKKYIFLIIAALVAFLLGIGFGALYQAERNKVQMQVMIDSLRSKSINSIVLYGAVSNISGRTLTITFQGDSTDVSVPENITIYSAGTDLEKYLQGNLANVNFSDIKVGDDLNINSTMTENGQMQANSVMILPPTN